MSNAELTEFHLNALSKFEGVRALTETGLSRVLKCEKVVARHAINTLKNGGFIKAYGAYEFSITTEGQLRLGGKVKPDPKAKREAAKLASPETTFKVIEDEPSPELTPREQAMLDAPVSQSVLDSLPEGAAVEAADRDEQEPAPAKPSFDDLVMAGLNRLCDQLRFNPVHVEHKRLKLNTLTTLADTLDGFDKSVSSVLRDIANDMNKLPEVRHGR